MARSVAVLVVGLLAAVITAGWTEAAAADDSPTAQPICCGPDSWTARRVGSYVHALNGQLEFGEVVADVAHDAVNEREVYFTKRSVARGPRHQHTYYLLYRDQLMYVYNKDNGECIKQTMTIPFRRRCVHASVTILDADVNYGTGAETINGGRFRDSVARKDGTTLMATWTVSQDCIPIAQRFSIVTPEGLKSEGAEFNNFHTGTVPDSLFQLPQACANAEFELPEYYPSIAFDL